MLFSKVELDNTVASTILRGISRCAYVVAGVIMLRFVPLSMLYNAHFVYAGKVVVFFYFSLAVVLARFTGVSTRAKRV